MFWIFIALSYLVISDNQIQVIANEIKADDITAEFNLSEKGVHIDVTWEKSINPYAIKVKSDCDKSCWKYVTLMDHTSLHTNISIISDHDCHFNQKCPYNVELVSSEGDYIWSKTLLLRNCINGYCLCEEESTFPKFSIRADFISQHNIKIYWFLNIKEMITNLSFNNIEFKEIKLINISVVNLTIPELFWGGSYVLIKERNFTINSTSQDVQGSWDLNSLSTFLPKQIFEIQATIIDSNNCKSVTERFKLIVPEGISFVTQLLIGLTIIAILTILIFVILKLIYNSKLTIWKNRYHTIGTRPINHMPMMESNILYKSNYNYFEICPSNITLRYEIGSGAFGKVFKGFLKLENGSTMIVAIKLLKKTTYVDLEEEFVNEIKTMKEVGKHNNIIQLFGCCTKQHPMMMIMEYAVGGNLLKYLKRIRRKQYNFLDNNEEDDDSFGFQGDKDLEIMLSGESSSYIAQPDRSPNILRPSLTDTLYTNLYETDETLNCQELHNFAFQIAEGMNYLEQKKITHRDLAARNILISEKKILKICDFGLSRNGVYVKRTKGKIPWKWLSIEAMAENFYSSKSDVWAFGVVLWEIGTLGVHPYPDINNSDVLKYLLNGNRLNKPIICSEELYNLMSNCWDADLHKRPSFSDILKILQPKEQHLYIQFGSNASGSNYVFSPLIK